MIKKFNIFEKIEWYQGGEFIEDDSPEDSPFDDFIKFLKEYDCLELFLMTLNKYMVMKRGKKKLTIRLIDAKTLKNYLKSKPVEDWIDSFDWTLNGNLTNWHGLHVRWRELCRVKDYKGLYEKIEWYEDGKFIEDDSPENLPESQLSENFKNFLRDHDALDKYIKNINYKKNRDYYNAFKDMPNELTENNFDELFHIFNNYTKRRNIIDKSLNWSSTPEGHGFWSNLNVLWRSKYTELHGFK